MRKKSNRPRVLFISRDGPLGFAIHSSDLFDVLRVEDLAGNLDGAIQFDPQVIVLDLRTPTKNLVNPLLHFAYDKKGDEIKMVAISSKDDPRFYYDVRVASERYLTARLLEQLMIHATKKSGPARKPVYSVLDCEPGEMAG